MSLNHKMGRAHEQFLATLLGGRRTRASGATWKDQMDGRHSREDLAFAFAWDGKSTRNRSIGVTRQMWDKAREQAGGERPLLALRWYTTDRLDVGEDLVVLDAHDFVELLQAANSNRPPTRVIFPVVAPDSLPRPGQKPLILWPDGRAEVGGRLVVTWKQEDSVRVTLDGRELRYEDGLIEIYVGTVLKYSVVPGALERLRVHP